VAFRRLADIDKCCMGRYAIENGPGDQAVMHDDFRLPEQSSCLDREQLGIAWPSTDQMNARGHYSSKCYSSSPAHEVSLNRTSTSLGRVAVLDRLAFGVCPDPESLSNLPQRVTILLDSDQAGDREGGELAIRRV
jgi:hypothetical protein